MYAEATYRSSRRTKPVAAGFTDPYPRDPPTGRRRTSAAGMRSGRSADRPRHRNSSSPRIPRMMLGNHAASHGAISPPLVSAGPRYIGT